MYTSVFTPHPPANPSSLPTRTPGTHPHLCCAAPLGRKGTPCVAIQTQLGGPRNLGRVLRVLPGTGGSWAGGGLGRRSSCPPLPSSVKLDSCCVVMQVPGSAEHIQASLGDAGCGFWRTQEEDSASASPAAS